MDFDLKLKALRGLANSSSQEASAALLREVQKTIAIIQNETRFEILSEQLSILDIVGHRVSEDTFRTLTLLLKRLDTIKITYSDDELSYGDDLKRYRNANSLTVATIDVLLNLRYLETTKVLKILLDLSLHKAEEVRKRAVDALGQIASYRIDVIYGDAENPGIGFQPQKLMLAELCALDDDSLCRHLPGILAVATSLLSPTMEQTSWTYKRLTVTSGVVPSGSDISDIRLHTIGLLKRLYGLSRSIEDKFSIISVLGDATRWHRIGSHPDFAIEVVSRDTQNVLVFFKGLIQQEDFAIVQKIEHKSYWIFHHALTDKVESAALEIEAEIRKNAEYQIYKVLIGFEGIFGEWREIKADKKPKREEDEIRRKQAREWVLAIDPDSWMTWETRLLRFAKTRSNDLATFPIFYYFLEQLALTQPKFALLLLHKYDDELESFLIPLIRGLFSSAEQLEIRTLISTWVMDGKHLYPSIKQYMANERLDAEMLDALLARAIELDDIGSIALTIAVVVSNYTSERKFLISRFFMPALQALTKRSRADWIFDIWYRAEMKVLLGDLEPAQVDCVLDNIMCLQKIDYHTEEILDLIARREPEKVMRLLCRRLAERSKDRKKFTDLYDAIPFELHKLKGSLAKIPRYAIEAVRELYDGYYGLFSLGGGRLLRNIFPDFPAAFEAELLNILSGREEQDVLFILAILRNYEGEPFLHRVCKEIIRIIPVDSELRNEVAVVLETTGVVTGEFGFADAYERKKIEVQGWLDDDNNKIQDFAKWYISQLNEMIESERKRGQESIALRKHRYGE